MRDYFSQRHDQEVKEFENWFKDHVATLHTLKNESGNVSVERLVWSKPDSGIFRINYIRDSGTLYVSGDLGEAVYCWSGDCSLYWMSQCGLSYFAGKCCASENGRRYSEWCHKQALVYAKEYVEEDEDLSWDNFISLGGDEALYSEDEWKEWVYNNGDEFFGRNWSETPMFGERISVRCHAHLYGLKMAMKALDVTETICSLTK